MPFADLASSAAIAQPVGSLSLSYYVIPNLQVKSGSLSLSYYVIPNLQVKSGSITVTYSVSASRPQVLSQGTVHQTSNLSSSLAIPTYGGITVNYDVFIPPLEQHVLYPDRDTYVLRSNQYSEYQYLSYGHLTDMVTGYRLYYYNNYSGIYPNGEDDAHALLHFNLSSLPAGRTIHDAELQLALFAVPPPVKNQAVSAASPYIPAKVQVSPLVGDFDEDQTTWLNQPSVNSSSVQINAPPVPTYQRAVLVTVDLTDWVIAWYTGQAANHGVRVDWSPTSYFFGSIYALVGIFAREIGDAAVMPRLVVNLVVPGASTELGDMPSSATVTHTHETSDIQGSGGVSTPSMASTARIAVSSNLASSAAIPGSGVSMLPSVVGVSQPVLPSTGITTVFSNLPATASVRTVGWAYIVSKATLIQASFYSAANVHGQASLSASSFIRSDYGAGDIQSSAIIHYSPDMPSEAVIRYTGPWADFDSLPSSGAVRLSAYSDIGPAPVYRWEYGYVYPYGWTSYQVIDHYISAYIHGPNEVSSSATIQPSPVYGAFLPAQVQVLANSNLTSSVIIVRWNDFPSSTTVRQSDASFLPSSTAVTIRQNDLPSTGKINHWVDLPSTGSVGAKPIGGQSIVLAWPPEGRQVHKS